MELKGTIKAILKTEEFKNNFKKRNLILTTDEKYPQHVAIEFLQDKTTLLDNYKAGEEVNISNNIRGKEWVNPNGETKYFNSIVGWKIEKLEAAQNNDNENIPPFVTEKIDLEVDDEADDFPF